MYKLSNASINNMKDCHPDNIILFTEAIKNSPIDFGVPSTGGVRTAEQQNALFNKGVTKADGYEFKSKHQIKRDGYGYANDFFAYVNGSVSYEKHHMAMVAAVILSTAIRLKKEGKITSDYYWGGQFGSADFNGWDMPHIERVS
jgi:peptidoglycan L-alanyl-D-glutamate endopeptidase CwlK